MNGYPGHHALAVFLKKKTMPTEGIEDIHSLQNYACTYVGIIPIMPDRSEWAAVRGLDCVIAPDPNNAPGRLRKKRGDRFASSKKKKVKKSDIDN
ncbi:hypothetical protein GEMRC1_012789 [Eukaryota sp. GEM-RC1]